MFPLLRIIHIQFAFNSEQHLRLIHPYLQIIITGAEYFSIFKLYPFNRHLNTFHQHSDIFSTLTSNGVKVVEQVKRFFLGVFYRVAAEVRSVNECALHDAIVRSPRQLSDTTAQLGRMRR